MEPRLCLPSLYCLPRTMKIRNASFVQDANLADLYILRNVCLLADPCDLIFCGNHATCELDDNDGTMCVCSHGYTGHSNSLGGCVG